MSNEKIETAAPVSNEQAADLAALSSAAAEQETALNPEQQGAPKVSLSEEIAGLINVAVKTLSPILPSLADIYNDGTVETAAGAIAAVCNKHGWLQGGMFGEYGEEIAAAFVLVPLAIATNQGVRGDIARAKAKVEGKPAASIADSQASQPGEHQKSVIIGSPVVEEN